MPRDYKSRAAPPRDGEHQPTAGWIWFLGGLLMGVFVSGLVWLKYDGVIEGQESKLAGQASEQNPAAQPEAADGEDSPPVPKPRFDFYTILPEMEVVVPDPEPEPAVVATPRSESEPTVTRQERSTAASYMLQMGSFRKYADAERRKASLALIGLEAEIQRVSVNGGEIFHRVRSGPYTREQVKRLRARLQSNKISSLTIKLRN